MKLMLALLMQKEKQSKIVEFPVDSHCDEESRLGIARVFSASYL